MIGIFIQSMQVVIRVARHRRKVRLLTELDERALRDIGLLRADVRNALANPWRDPSRRLKALCCHWHGSVATLEGR
jgi:uncharacterized protein YjiS (DUF1127 family)